ncbi:MAG: hypothetical protein IIW14_08725 [Kiritimatiellae bacterium]|nr:hypothetical protein [Kiritimatiellia bacterium]
MRNGAAAETSALGETGGALTGRGDAAAIECVFTNNAAIRGCAASEVTLIRCRVIANGTGLYFGDYYGNAGTVVDCVFSGGAGVYSKASVINSTFEYGSQLKSPTAVGQGLGGTNDTFNSIIYANDMNRSFRNCVFRSSGLLKTDSCSADADCRFNVTDAVDANLRPVAGATNLIDRGKNEYYDTYFPKRWLRFKNGRDFAGGSRVYAAVPDIGAGEYDARADFAGRLSRRLTVDAATANVELGEESGLTMKGGDVLEMRWQLRQGGTCQFRAVGAGGASVTVSVNGVELRPDALGVYSFAGLPGEQTLTIACFGAGTASVDSFSCPPWGVIMTVR